LSTNARGQRDWAFVCAATALGEPGPSRRIETFTTEHEAEAPFGYPEFHYLTSPLRAASVRAGDPQAVNVWAASGFQRPSPRRSPRSSRA
jgi:hypothetical protein